MARSKTSASSATRIEIIEAILKRLAPTQTERHLHIAVAIEQRIFGGGSDGTRGKIGGVRLPSSVLQRAFVRATEQVRDGGQAEIVSLGSYLTTMLLNIARDSRAVDPRPALEEDRIWARQLRKMLRAELTTLEESDRDTKRFQELQHLLEERGTRGRASEGERWVKAAEAALRVRSPKRAERRELDGIEQGYAWNTSSDQRRYQCATLLRWAARERGKPGLLAARRLEVLLSVCSLAKELDRLPKSTDVHRFVARNTFVPQDPKDLLHRTCSRQKNCGGCRIVRLDLEWCKSVLHALDDPNSRAPNFAALRDFDLSPRGRLADERETVLDFLETHFQSTHVKNLRTSSIGSEAWSTAARALTNLGRELRKADAVRAKS